MVKQKALKAFAYIRVSTEIQVEDGYSLDNQEYEIKEFLKKENMILSGIYKDAGRSGKNISGRPDFQRMLDDIDSGVEVDYVVVYSLSRFGRNAADVFQSLQILERNGVFLHCIKEKTDSAGTFGKAMLQLLSVFAELERNNIRETTRGGRYQKAREGKYNRRKVRMGKYTQCVRRFIR